HNLYHVVFENGVYETSGSQDVPGRRTADLKAIALASGYRLVTSFDDADEMRRNIESTLLAEGPVFISIAISAPGDLGDIGPGVAADKPTQILRMRTVLS